MMKTKENGFETGDIVKLEINGNIETDMICGFSRVFLFDTMETGEIAIMQEHGFVPLSKLIAKI
jgi:hypothetical protein